MKSVGCRSNAYVEVVGNVLTVRVLSRHDFGRGGLSRLQNVKLVVVGGCFGTLIFLFRHHVLCVDYGRVFDVQRA